MKNKALARVSIALIAIKLGANRIAQQVPKNVFTVSLRLRRSVTVLKTGLN